MTYFLDTNICAYILNGSHPDLNKRYLQYNKNDIKMPSVVLFELLYGIEKSSRKNDNYVRIQEFISEIEIIPFNENAAEIAGIIRADLERKGEPIGAYDLLIAATALAHSGIVVTNNTREFSRVNGLSVEDWTVL